MDAAVCPENASARYCGAVSFDSKKRSTRRFRFENGRISY